MSKDGPSSGHMGFGFQQSCAAGVPFVRPSSNGQINLRKFLESHPELLERAAKMVTNGRHAATILDEFRDEGLEGEYYIALFRDSEFQTIVRDHYSDDRAGLEQIVKTGFKDRIYTAAVLLHLDREAGEWTDLRRWPEEKA